MVRKQLLFVSLAVEKTSKGTSFSVIQSQLVNGKLKRPMPSEVPQPDHFVLEFQDAGGTTITQVATENPLTRVVEVASERGTFSRQALDLDKASMVVRIQYIKGIKTLKISNPQGQLLSTLNLDL